MANTDDQQMLDTYRTVVGASSMLAIAPSFVPRPTAADYKFGEISRYFAQQTNQPNGEIIEIAKNTYDSLSVKSLFRVVNLRWRISGPANNTTDPITGEINVLGVMSANQAAIRQAAKTMPAIGRKLTNTIQLWNGF
jgi:hypothetical protein